MLAQLITIINFFNVYEGFFHFGFFKIIFIMRKAAIYPIHTLFIYKMTTPTITKYNYISGLIIRYTTEPIKQQRIKTFNKIIKYKVCIR